jgi:hypothetical protein
MQAGPRSPDALGLSRLQHACAELHTQQDDMAERLAQAESAKEKHDKVATTMHSYQRRHDSKQRRSRSAFRFRHSTRAPSHAPWAG